MHCVKKRLFQNSHLKVRLQSQLAAIKEPTPLPKIQLPFRIKRQPADLLKALASTVGTDPTACHYRYADDPILLPYNAHNQQTYALSKEAGRKAAKYMTTRFSLFFQYDIDEPRIDAFRRNDREFLVDKMISEAELNEELLIECLDNGWTSKAAKMYQTGLVECSPETKIRLLEHLAFHNCLDEELNEFRERYFFTEKREIPVCQWPDGIIAEIFHSIEPKTARCYAAVVCNLSKYGKHQEALKLYDEMEESCDMTSFHDSTLYDHVIVCYTSSVKGQEKAWDLVTSLLRRMAERNVQPTIRTFNSVLQVLSETHSSGGSVQRAYQVFREMKALEIPPSPASFDFLLKQLKGTKELGSLVDFSLSHFESGQVTVGLDSRDFAFLPNCMVLIDEQLRDINLAYRLYAIAQHPDYRSLITSQEASRQFYSHLVDVLSMYERTEKFVDFFETIFPHVYASSRDQLRNILESLSASQDNAQLLRLYPAIVAAGFLKIGYVVSALVHCLFTFKTTDETLRRQFGDLAFDLKTKVDVYIADANRLRGRYQQSSFHWKQPLINKLAQVCERAGQIERSKLIAATKCSIGSGGGEEPGTDNI